jgi:hypothetical protein
MRTTSEGSVGGCGWQMLAGAGDACTPEIVGMDDP